ncbi:tripartite tricarboxylate transporter TctB family protein [Solicola sp. PLA-1-18]|uniref:tripartite tricarboxylate transporter TctB family protein n=1 Tax=Solicola sp. PLA-1-18 TaxID=3380532 RepID=UPI003B77ECAF
MKPETKTVEVPDQEEPISPLWSAVVAAVVAAVGAAAVVGSLRLGYWTEIGPGPGFFPLWLGVILTVLGLIWLQRSVRELLSGSPEEVRPPTADEGVEPYSWSTVGAILGSLVVLASVLDLVGYQLSMLVFLVFHLKVLGRRGWLLTLVLSVAGSFGVFVVFTRLLTVNLPASSLPFLAGLGL